MADFTFEIRLPSIRARIYFRIKCTSINARTYAMRALCEAQKKKKVILIELFSDFATYRFASCRRFAFSIFFFSHILRRFERQRLHYIRTRTIVGTYLLNAGVYRVYAECCRHTYDYVLQTFLHYRCIREFITRKNR